MISRPRSLLQLASFFILSVCAASAQTATASLGGVVEDASRAAISDAKVVLRNLQTNVEKTTTSNSSGSYDILDILPGNYTLEASKTGFRTTKIDQFTLAVDQTANVNFTLSVGSVTESVAVQASVGQLESSTAELGTVIPEKQVVDLPLNGRNFTQLLLLSPGASPTNVGQSSSGFTTAGIGTFAYPAMNGQSNRSNIFLLDGSYNLGLLGAPVLNPIIDTIAEFKVQSHSDLPEFGQGTGGVVSVVTKSGTNAFHGSAWEFLRNNDLDARNYFVPTITPFHQNQFGAAGGGPILKNKAFFYGGYQGFHLTKPSNTLYGVPTPANLIGDLSNTSAQIYDPFSTRPDPANPGQYLRDPFPGNIIPQSRINQGMLAYLKATVPLPNYSGPGGFNAIDTTPVLMTSTEWTIRDDYTLTRNDQVWFRWSHADTPTATSGGRQTLANTTDVVAKNVAANWVHVFGATGTLTAHFARNTGSENQTELFRASAVPNRANLVQQIGLAQSACCSFNGGISTLLPGYSVPGYFSGGETNSPNLITNVWEYGGNFNKLLGRHTLGLGADLQSFPTFDTNGHAINVYFTSNETSNPENPGSTGNALASYLLSVPNNASYTNQSSTSRWGGVLAFYGQDEWRITPNLTMNYGIRYDRTYVPGFGHFKDGSIYTGNYDLSPGKGVYILQAKPPSCAQAGAPPCIPTPDGSLPDHVVVSPNQKYSADFTDNVQPRFGTAFRLNPKTAIRGGIGVVFDSWAGVIENVQGIGGSWPNVLIDRPQNLNNPTPTQLTPGVTAQNPVTGVTFPAPTPFNQQGYFYDPNYKNAYSIQWNIGVENQLTSSTLVAINYVGSVSRRTNIGVPYNTATTPGPGPIQNRQPFPYIKPTNYSRGVGTGNYNGLQTSIERRYSSNLALTVSYTWSKAISEGCDGWFGVEGCSVQNVYNLRADRSASAIDLRQIFIAGWVYALPFGPGQAFNPQNRILSQVIGGWQTNGIASLHTGPPFSVLVSGDIANTGNFGSYERLNIVGNPTPLSKTPKQWFNTAAFAAPAPFTFGNSGRNNLRSPGLQNYDLAVFRQFPLTWIREAMRLEIRAEAFNAFNHTHFGAPGNNLSSPSTFGVISTATGERQLQLAAKFYF